MFFCIYICLSCFNQLAASDNTTGSKSNSESLRQPGKCDVTSSNDLSAMALPPSFSKIYRYTLDKVKELPLEKKHVEGLTILLNVDMTNRLSSAYSSYYLAQMYDAESSQTERRISLLTEAVSSSQLYGAELDDAFFSLFKLYESNGDERASKRYYKSWQRHRCGQQYSVDNGQQPSPKAIGNTALIAPTVLPPKSDNSAFTNGLKGHLKNDSSPSLMETKVKTRSSNIQPERLLEYLEPVYPEHAFSNNIEGFVALSMTITRDGFVTNVEVVNSEPKGVFVRAAITAVKQWRFQPQTINGKNSEKSEHKIRLLFEIENTQN